jgi:uncharacterized iron-regulated membrane protein
MRSVFTPGFYRGAVVAAPVGPPPPLKVSLDVLLARSAQRVPDFVPHGMFLAQEPPGRPRYVVFWGNDRRRFFLLSPWDSRVWFDADTGAFAGAALIGRAPVAVKLESATRPLHFGSWGGLRIKVVYAACALAPPLLALTGSVLWLRRRRNLLG